MKVSVDLAVLCEALFQGMEYEAVATLPQRDPKPKKTVRSEFQAQPFAA
jgi:hypothetical protein